MTLLLGGSILLIAGSAVALVVGWVDANETYIWTSIGATAAAALLLGLAFFRSRSQAAATAVETPRGAPIDPEIVAQREERSQEKYERPSTRGKDDAETGPAGGEQGGAETQVLAPDAAGGAGAAGGAPDTRGAAADAGGAATAATVGVPAGGAEGTTVVAVPKKKKFHRPECRFASAKDTETIDRADAEGRGFEPCGVCKP